MKFRSSPISARQLVISTAFLLGLLEGCRDKPSPEGVRGTYVGHSDYGMMLVELRSGNRYFMTFSSDDKGSTGIYTIVRDTVYLSYEGTLAMTFAVAGDSLVWQDAQEFVLHRQPD